MGSFTLHKNSAKPAVLLAGGIGITPFISIVRQVDHDRLPHKLHLFCSNRRPEDTPFLDTLQMLEKSNSNFQPAGEAVPHGRGGPRWHRRTGRRDGADQRLPERDALSEGALQGNAPPVQSPVWIERIASVTSETAGVFYPTVKRGWYVQQGMKIGYVTDLFGKTAWEARAAVERRGPVCLRRALDEER
jgi:hypothetical protein